MAEIRLENIRKKFGDATVVMDLSLTINDGEFFTFVGPSGCGKSTVLNMIAGLEDATEGVISFDGKAVNDLSPKERDVAMVFQSYALYPHIAVMKEGEVQQCGTPLEVYRRPSNIFVAGFMGSPTMNFIPATVKRRDPLEIECFGFLVSPGVERKPEAESVVAGIRPEDVTVSPGRSEGSVEVVVALVEPAGSWNWVDLDRMGVTIKGISAPDTAYRREEKPLRHFLPTKSSSSIQPRGKDFRFLCRA